MSSGIQLNPRTYSGTSLTVMPKLRPTSSSTCSTTRSRKPTRRVCVSSTSPSEVVRVTTRSCRVCGPSPAGHQRSGAGTSRRACARTAPGSTSTWTPTSPILAIMMSAESEPTAPERSSSTSRSTTPSTPSRRIVGRSALRRAVDQASISTRRQIPDPGSAGPQSQPNAQAFLRMNGDRSLKTLHRAPRRSRSAVATATGESMSMRRATASAASSGTGTRHVRCMLLRRARSSPSTRSTACVSTPWRTRSMRSAVVSICSRVVSYDQSDCPIHASRRSLSPSWGSSIAPALRKAMWTSPGTGAAKRRGVPSGAWATASGTGPDRAVSCHVAGVGRRRSTCFHP